MKVKFFSSCSDVDMIDLLEKIINEFCAKHEIIDVKISSGESFCDVIVLYDDD